MNQKMRAVDNIRIYLINMPNDIDRRKRMENQLTEAGLTMTMRTAVVGREISEAQIKEIYDDEKNRKYYFSKMTPGEIGCYASHMAIWKEVVKNKDAIALVLEDDVDINRDIKELMHAVLHIDKNWHMIKLIGRKKESIARRMRLSERFELIQYKRIPSLTGGYLINAAGAKRLLETRKPFFRPVDVDLRYWWENNINILGCQPYPVENNIHSTTSTIGNKKTSSGISYRTRRVITQIKYTWHSIIMNSKIQKGIW